MNILETYGGWMGLIIYFLYKDVWPVFSHKIIPSKIKELESEREFHRMQEANQIANMNMVAKATQLLSESMVQTNERIAFIMDNQKLIISQGQATYNILSEGIADMRAVTGTRTTSKKNRNT